MLQLTNYRTRIINGIRRIRQERAYTQVEFANLLGLSQQQFSKIERGEGTISAEQLLVILDKFNLPISYFVANEPKENSKADILQNGLVRFGATELKEITGVFISERYENLNNIIIDVLDAKQPSRLIVALAPAITKNIQQIAFDQIENELRRWGRENRLWWVAESTLESLRKQITHRHLNRDIKSTYSRAATLLTDIELVIKSRENGNWYRRDKSADILDENIFSGKTLERIKSERDNIAKQWNIVTSIKQSDFENALVSSEQ